MTMDFHLDTLLNLPNLTVESCTQEEKEVFLKLRFLSEASDCPHCHNPSDKLHQNRPVLIRDLPVFGQSVYLHLPRRQFYCCFCQRYFTEQLSFEGLGTTIHSALRGCDLSSSSNDEY